MSESSSLSPPLGVEPDQRLQQLWQQGQRPDLRQFLADSGDLSPAEVLAVLLVDQRQRWQKGERVGAEQYLGLAPALHANVEHTIQLIYGEYLLREELGETPMLQEYAERFPAYAERLKLQVELHRALGSNTDPGEAVTAVGHAPLPAVIRCPHCQNPIQLIEERPEEVLCPACGSSFRVREARQSSMQDAMRPLGKFELLERVGIGAFGAVWRARDTELDRIVALKIPHASLLSSKADLERFHREARAAAQLRHPGIVTVHEVQILDGLPTIVSDFVEGVPLNDLLESRRLTFREAAALIADVAEALDYAHSMGLVHRDIKPANIMIESGRVARPESSKGVAEHTSTSCTPFEDSGRATRLGRPLIMDFGLALRQEAETTLTLDGHIVGTPAYMSPEQAAGMGHQADRRSDVYSAGVILYELLCGELPFRGSTRMLLNQVLHEEPRPPRRLNDKIPRDLETICRKAMAKAPGRRYATARELADDLRRFLKGEAIRARPVGVAEKGFRWAKRQPVLAALAVSVVVLVLGVAAISTVAAIWLRAERDKALTGLLDSHFAQAHALRHSGQVGRRFRSLELLADVAKVRPSLEVRNEAIGCLALVDLRIAKEWSLDPACREEPGFDATLERYAVGDQAGNISIRRVADNLELIRLPGFDVVSRIHRFSPDGQHLAVKYHQGRNVFLYVWDLSRQQVVLKTPIGDSDGVGDFSPDGRWLAASHQDHDWIDLYDLRSGQENKRLHSSRFAGPFRFDPDGGRLAVAADHAGVQIHELQTGEVKVLDQPAGVKERGIYDLAWDPGGKLVAAACDNSHVYIWDAERSRKPAIDLKGHQGQVVRVVFSRRGDLLASSSWDGHTHLWDPSTGRLLLRTPTEGYVQAFRSDDGLLAFGNEGSRIWLWGVAAGQECRNLPNEATFPSVHVSSDIRLLASVVNNGVRIWDLANVREVAFLPLGACKSVAFHPDGKTLFTCGERGIQRWPIQSRTMAGTIRICIGPPQIVGVPSPGVIRAYLSPDGRSLGAIRHAGEAHILDLGRSRAEKLC